MRHEKVFGFLGLALCGLFPLVGVLQLGDADAGWRDVAARARPSVVQVMAGGGTVIASGVVVESRPLRVAVAGRASGIALSSPLEGRTVEWRVCWEDPHGEFTLLEAQAGVAVASAAPVDPAAIGDVAASPNDQTAVSAVLVAPASRVDVPMWVGVLVPARTSDGRPSFQGDGLRMLRSETLAAAEAQPVAPPVDPLLRGAPFVSRDGVVLALYSGARDGVVRAVPMALVREAVTALERHAAH